MITDPTIDLSMVLKWYVPESEWDTWLEKYGIKRDKYFIERVYWYLLLNSVSYVYWHFKRSENDQVNIQLNRVAKLNRYIYNTILT